MGHVNEGGMHYVHYVRHPMCREFDFDNAIGSHIKIRNNDSQLNNAQNSDESYDINGIKYKEISISASDPSTSKKLSKNHGIGIKSQDAQTSKNKESKNTTNRKNSKQKKKPHYTIPVKYRFILLDSCCPFCRRPIHFEEKIGKDKIPCFVCDYCDKYFYTQEDLNKLCRQADAQYRDINWEKICQYTGNFFK